ncbi:lipopolysaccharide assembly LapA domain-containing protein [Streptacidiphilus sp. MAP5-3]|uniref:LapA family protein n=1 Tax=unclassified Streptacidiphilus TaxID=2643834 RepID=UPI003516AFE8
MARKDSPASSPDTAPSGARQSQGPHPHLRRTRLSSAWVATIVASVVLVLLLIFILENSDQVDVSFLGAHGHLPLGVALLLAAVCGVLLVAVPGTARIMQLRRAGKKLAANPPAPSTRIDASETGTSMGTGTS